MYSKFILLTLLIVALAACKPTQQKIDKEITIKSPSFFPKIKFPDDNRPTAFRVELGRRLFYEKKLSAQETMSCASCHVTSMAFTDGRQTSVGAHGKKGKRNAPTLANLAWMPRFMMEGGVPTLELQVLAPIQDSIEMDLPLHEAAVRLRSIKKYNDLSLVAYGKELDENVIMRALANFQRTFVSADSRFDRWYYYKDSTQFNDSEKRGKAIFFSEKAACMKCHSLPFFTDFEYYNIGLYKRYADHGKERITYNKADIGKFKTPTLRNIELTAPYMHDGSINTLEEVIEIYNKGGEGHENQDFRVRPMNWTVQEKEDLLAFLKTLTDWNFVQNQSFLPLSE
jgi:cytochrome c peroxidase